MNATKLATFLGLAMVLCVQSAWAQLGTPKHDVRVARILEAEEIKFEIDSDGDFNVTFDVGGGRSQMAIIMSNTSEYRNFEIREILAIGYRGATDQFPASVANQLLEDTYPKKLGAWAKQGKLAVFIVRVDADADAESLVSALKLTLEAADEMEEKLTGDTDEF